MLLVYTFCWRVFRCVQVKHQKPYLSYAMSYDAAYCSVPGTLEEVCSQLTHKSAYYTLVKGRLLIF